MGSIPEAYHDLFERESFAHFATMLPDGMPHVTPVWIDYEADADRVVVNTERGRRKERNVRANPKVGVSVLDPDDPYRYCSLTGRVVEVTTEGAVEHIDALARRYMGVEEYPNHGDEDGERVRILVDPDRVLTG